MAWHPKPVGRRSSVNKVQIHSPHLHPHIPAGIAESNLQSAIWPLVVESRPTISLIYCNVIFDNPYYSCEFVYTYMHYQTMQTVEAVYSRYTYMHVTGAVTAEELSLWWKRVEKKSCKEPGTHLLLGESPGVGISSILEPAGTDLRVKVGRMGRHRRGIAVDRGHQCQYRQRHVRVHAHDTSTGLSSMSGCGISVYSFTPLALIVRRPCCNYLRTYWADCFQISVAACPEPYTQTCFEILKQKNAFSNFSAFL